MGLNRPAGRYLIIALFAAVSTTFLALMSMIWAPTSRADDPDDALTALMMGGSGMPTPSEFWQNGIITDYIDPATGGNYTPVLVPTPESFASTSVPTGLADLQAAMGQQGADQPYLVEGYSQSAVIAIDEELQLIQSGQAPPDATFLLLGSLNRPDGGLFERFPGLIIPGTAGFDFNGAELTDAGIPTIDIANQYDFFADFPQYPINGLADLNAIFGIIYAHAAYGNGPLPEEVPSVWPPSEPLTGPYASEYVLGSTEIVKQVDGDTTFYFVPTTELPLLDPLQSLGVPESVLNIFQPALQVIVEAGYDRSIPFGDPTPAELIPTIDPVTFSLELDNALVQGANNAFELFGAQLPGATELESALTSDEAWSEQAIGVPYDQVVTELNNSFDPFTLFTDIEGPIGQDIENLLEQTDIQQAVIDPILGLFGPLAGIFTT
ncbi:MAG: PE-PPE domain-containing protein [Mycobacterium sp.]|uniref:PE-PPE domain-containing protein n=1 Tax=Mycobacterium sp. TaxID=1785 RepID=UPI003F97971D